MKLQKNQDYECVPAFSETDKAILDAASATLADCWKKAKRSPLLVAPREDHSEGAGDAVIGNRAAIVDYLRYTYAHRTTEHAVCVLMDTYGRLIAVEEIDRGDSRSCRMPLRTLAQLCILHAAHYVVLSHNHPGGSCHPSAGDKAATENTIKFLSQMDVTVLDHIVTATSGVASVLLHMATRDGKRPPPKHAERQFWAALAPSGGGDD